MSANVLVTGHSLHTDAVRWLETHELTPRFIEPYATADQVVEAVRALDPVAVIVRTGRVDARCMEAGASLRVVVKHGVGYDNIDVAAATARGLPVLIAAGVNAQSVAEHALALMLALTKGLLRLDARLRDGHWDKQAHAGVEMQGLTLGLVGFGAIARATARLGGGFGMNVVACDPFADDATFAAAGVTRRTVLGPLLEESDIVSIHCPLTPETRDLIGAEALARIKPSAFLINTARGGIVDEGALVAALRDGRIAGAGLDTFASEPPEPDNPLWRLPNVVVTPHVAGVTAAASARVALEAAKGVTQILAGETVDPSRIVNGAQLGP